MKKLFWFVLCIIVGVTSWGQGIVDFNTPTSNTAPNPGARVSNDVGIVDTNRFAQLHPRNPKTKSLVQVAEPNAVTLSILGVAALWLLRRKR